MGFRFKTFNAIYRRLNGTVHPRRVLRRGSQTLLPMHALDLEGACIFQGAWHMDSGRRSHMGHAQHHHHRHDEAGVAGERVSKLGLAADITLASGKAVAGYLSGSTAIIADAAHSVSDVGCHHLRGRKAGSMLHLDVHIEVDPFLSVSAAHNIGEAVRRRLQEHHAEVAEAFIHIDPADSHICSAIKNPSSNFKEEEEKFNSLVSSTQQQEAERTVHHVLSSRFSEIMTVERVTCHFLQGKVLVQVEISMSPDMLIREAMDSALVAEKEILKAASEISSIDIQLRLGHQLEELQSQRHS